jgi:hypothetical protein
MGNILIDNYLPVLKTGEHHHDDIPLTTPCIQVSSLGFTTIHLADQLVLVHGVVAPMATASPLVVVGILALPVKNLSSSDRSTLKIKPQLLVGTWKVGILG